jgi:hypothetical protein
LQGTSEKIYFQNLRMAGRLNEQIEIVL